VLINQYQNTLKVIGRTAILLTFDYELFQGKRSGTVANCILKPTGRLLEVLKRNKATAIFFIDMLYLCRLAEAAQQYESAQKDLALIEEQLLSISESGHYVFNHLHPHWLDAVYDPAINEWRLEDDSKYAFSGLTEKQRESVFDQTMVLLNKILSEANLRRDANGFRAGGLYIQPFTDFKEHFDRHGIIYEFSVLAKARGELKNGNAAFDFSGVKKNIYHFENNITEEESDGHYTEIALSSAEIPFGYRLLNSIYYRFFYGRSKTYRRYGDGVSTPNKITFPFRAKYTSTEICSVEMLNCIKLPRYLNQAKRAGYLHLLSHPKLISENNLSTFDRLLQQLNLRNAEYDFKKFST
jgi:hypothetical protein